MDSISKARRNLDDARTILREKANKEEGYYQDAKYVRMAGRTAYAGVLMALNDVLGLKRNDRKDVDWYGQQLLLLNKDVLSAFRTTYQVLHLSMIYDGLQDAVIVEIGLKRADSIIDWVEQRSTAAA
ncbi:DUF5618 family protein [Spirosoma rhododendri]|uniref:DUF5618 family protein n=1 Tax=Spirosoma rhododendri TaxID=2728024 RepID=A0A7L5DNT2_9BACT|nr:DUF5618 family protein [Spirosoma rhododendri]QJD80154.1 DUF5618 family protein [Spirosoma rhododendri]